MSDKEDNQTQTQIVSTPNRVPEEDQELRQLYVKMSSTIDEGPLHESSCQRLKQDLSYKADFHGDIFLEFFIYHIVFYMVLGPIMIIFFIGKTHFMRNLGFWSISGSSIFQNGLWFGQIVCSTIYFATDTISDIEIGLLWFSVFLRSLVAGAKYATMTIERIELYKSVPLEDRTTKFDIVLYDWSEQSRKIQCLEILRAIKRHDFDTTLFTFDFLVQPSEQTIQELDKIELDCELESDGVNGIKLLCYLIDQFQKHIPPHYIVGGAAIKTIIIIVTPVLLKIPQYQLVLPTTLELVLIVVASIIKFASLNCAIVYLHIALYDQKRKAYLLEQCYYMMSTKRIKCVENKLLPTINLNNQRTIEAWSILRSIIFDYGASQHLRSQSFYSITFLGCIISIVVGIQMILGYFTIEFKLSIALGSIFFMLWGFVIMYLYRAAVINTFFNLYSTQIENLKFIYIDLKRMQDQYFRKNVQPQNYIHKSFVNQLKQQFGNDYAAITLNIESIVESLDDGLRHIEYDSRNYPLRLYGVKVTFGLLQSVGMTLCTIISFAIQQRLSQEQQQ